MSNFAFNSIDYSPELVQSRVMSHLSDISNSFDNDPMNRIKQAAPSLLGVNNVRKTDEFDTRANNLGFNFSSESIYNQMLDASAKKFNASAASRANATDRTAQGFNIVNDFSVVNPLNARASNFSVTDPNYLLQLIDTTNSSSPTLSQEYAVEQQIRDITTGATTLNNLSLGLPPNDNTGVYQATSSVLPVYSTEAEQRLIGYYIHTQGQTPDRIFKINNYQARSSDRYKPDQNRALERQVQNFVSRADIGTYNMLLNQPGKFRGTFFQLQNTQFLSKLLTREGGYEMVTQQYSQETNKVEDNRVRILAPNDLGIAASARQRQQGINTNSSIQGVKYAGSFHAKVGYVGDENGEYTAFIGTQNITPALSRHSSIESLFMIKSTDGVLGELLGRELSGITDTIINLANERHQDQRYNGYVLPGEVQQRAGQDRMFTFTGTEIFKEFERVIDIASNANERALGIAANQGVSNRDKVFISMGEISMLLSNSDKYSNRTARERVQKFKDNLLVLAKEGRLNIITDIKSFNRIHDTTNTNIDRNFINQLSVLGALNTAVTTWHHDKVFAIFGEKDNKLKFQSIGSANLSDSSLMAINDLADSDYKTELINKMIALGAPNSAFENTSNTEVVMAIGVDEYFNEHRLNALSTSSSNTVLKNSDTRSQFEKDIENIFTRNTIKTVMEVEVAEGKTKKVNLLTNSNETGRRNANQEQNPLYTHMNALSAGGLDDKTLYKTGYMSEQVNTNFTDNEVGLRTLATKDETFKRKQLTDMFETLNAIDGVSVTYRHSVDKAEQFNRLGIDVLSPVGLNVNIKSSDGAFDVTMHLTATEEGSFILSDLNKVLNGALYVNKSEEDQTLFRGTDRERVVKKGESSQLTAFETTLGFVQTIKRNFLYQQESGLVNTVFNFQATKNEGHYINLIKQITAEQLSVLQPHLAVDTNKQQLTMLGGIQELRKLGDTEYRQHIELLRQMFISGSHIDLDAKGAHRADKLNLTSDRLQARIVDINRAFNYLTSSEHLDLNVAHDLFARELYRVLMSDQDNAFNDIKREIINRDSRASAQYRGAAKAQSRMLLTEISAPFLAAHEETYSGYQGQTRLPVYGEKEDFGGIYGDSEYARVLQDGILNPLDVSHGARLSHGGHLFRALGSTSYGNTLQLPGFGGLRQLTIVDSDISSDATVVHDWEKLTKSTHGFARIEQTPFLDSLQRILQANNGDQLDQQEQESIARLFSHGALLSNPFPKIEQLGQRTKNVAGIRGSYDIDSKFVRQVFNKLGISDEEIRKYGLADYQTKSRVHDSVPDDIDITDILAGRLKTVLPEAQFNELMQTVRDNPDITYEELQKRYRTKLGNPTLTEKGFIGGSKIRRIAIHSGMSLFGDFNYLNPNYEQHFGKIKRIRAKINPDKTENVTQIQEGISRAFAKGAVVTSQEYDLAEEMTVKRVTHQGEEIIKTKKLERGLYTFESDGTIIQIGRYIDAGFIQLNNVHTVKDTPVGRRLEGVKIKLPAFADREEGGISYIHSDVHLTQTSRGTLIFEADATEIKMPGSNSRLVGSGLLKGPGIFLQPKMFENLQKTLKSRKNKEGKSYQEFLPTAVKNDKLFGLMSYNTFKGFNYEMGLELLTDNSSRSALYGVDNQELARSLSILFLGDSEVKESLIKNLYSTDDVYAASAIKQTKGYDISKKRKSGGTTYKDDTSAFAQIAAGLQLIANEGDVKTQIVNQDFDGLKLLIKQTLDGTNSDPDTLRRQVHKLFGLATSNSVVRQDGSRQILINEQDPIARGAGLVAHMLFLNRQLYFDPNKTKKVSHGGLFEAAINDIDLYYGVDSNNNIITDRGGFTSQSYKYYVDTVLAHQGEKLEAFDTNTMSEAQIAEIKKRNKFKLDVKQAMLNNDVVMENLIEANYSQSLVPTGMKDSAKMEFQYLVGLSNRQMDMFRKQGGETSSSIQTAYFSILKASNSSAFTTASATGNNMQHRYMFYTEDNLDNVRQGHTGFITKDMRLLNLLTMSYLAEGSGGLITGAVKDIISGETTDNIEKMVLKLRQSSVDGFVSDSASDYSAGMLQLEASLIRQSTTISREIDQINVNEGTREEILAKQELIRKKRTERRRAIVLSQELRETKQLILPSFTSQATDDGRHQVFLHAASEAEATYGVILGTDILSNVSLEFGNYKAEVLGAQLELLEAMEYAKPVLDKIWAGKSNVILDDHELSLLHDLEATMERSRISLVSLINTDLMRQAFGDHEGFTGASGIAVNSFVLNPDEYIAGERYMRLSNNNKGQTNVGIFTRDAMSLYLKNQGVDANEHFNNLSRVIHALNPEADLADFTTKAERIKGFMTGKDKPVLKKTGKDMVESLIRTFYDSKIKTHELKPSEIADLEKRKKDEIKALREDKQRTLTKTEGILLLQAETYSKMLGISTDQALQLIITSQVDTKANSWSNVNDARLTPKGVDKVTTLDAILNHAMGAAIARGGQPAGSSGSVQEANIYRGIHQMMQGERVDALSHHLKEGKKGAMKVDFRRFGTGLLVPSLSRLMAGLGDYDGDSYRLVLNNVDAKLKSIVDDQFTLKSLDYNSSKLRKRIDKIRSLDPRLDTSKRPSLVYDTTIVRESAQYLKGIQNIESQRYSAQSALNKIQEVDSNFPIENPLVYYSEQDGDRITRTLTNFDELIDVKYGDLRETGSRKGHRGVHNTRDVIQTIIPYLDPNDSELLASALRKTTANNTIKTLLDSLDLDTRQQISRDLQAKGYRQQGGINLDNVRSFNLDRLERTIYTNDTRPREQLNEKIARKTAELEYQQQHVILDSVRSSVVHLASDDETSYQGHTIRRLKDKETKQIIDPVTRTLEGNNLRSVTNRRDYLQQVERFILNSANISITATQLEQLKRQSKLDHPYSSEKADTQYINSVLQLLSEAERQALSEELARIGFTTTNTSDINAVAFKDVIRTVYAYEYTTDNYGQVFNNIIKGVDKKLASHQSLNEHLKTFKTTEETMRQSISSIAESVEQYSQEVDSLKSLIAEQAENVKSIDSLLFNSRHGANTDDNGRTPLEVMHIADYPESLPDVLRARIDAYNSLKTIGDNLRQPGDLHSLSLQLETISNQLRENSQIHPFLVSEQENISRQKEVSRTIAKHSRTIRQIADSGTLTPEQETQIRNISKEINKLTSEQLAIDNPKLSHTIIETTQSNILRGYNDLDRINTNIEALKTRRQSINNYADTLRADIQLDRNLINSNLSSIELSEINQRINERTTQLQTLDARNNSVLQEIKDLKSQRLTVSNLINTDLNTLNSSEYANITRKLNDIEVLAAKPLTELTDERNRLITAGIANDADLIKLGKVNQAINYKMAITEIGNLDEEQRINNANNPRYRTRVTDNIKEVNWINQSTDAVSIMGYGLLERIAQAKTINDHNEIIDSNQRIRDDGGTARAIHRNQFQLMEMQRDHVQLYGMNPLALNEFVLEQQNLLYGYHQTDRMPSAITMEYLQQRLLAFDNAKRLIATSIPYVNSYQGGLNQGELSDNVLALNRMVLREQLELIALRKTFMDSHMQDIDDRLGLMRSLEDSIIQSAESIYQDTEQEKDVLQNRISTGLDSLEADMQLFNRLEAKALTDMRRNIVAYKGLPDFFVNEILNTEGEGGIFSMLRQKFDLSNLDDAASHAAKAEQSIMLFNSLKTNTTFDSYVQAGNYTEVFSAARVAEYTAHIMQEQRNMGLTYSQAEVQQKVEDFLIISRGKNITSLEAYDRTVMEYETTIANLSMSFEGVGNTLKKAAGSILNPFEYEGVMRAGGIAGTTLIGEAYNTFLPLIDQTLIDTAFISNNSSASLEAAILQFDSGVNDPNARLGDHYVGQEARERTFARFTSTLAVFSNMQQIVRDALKPKEGGQLLALFDEPIFEDGKSLTQLLQEDTGDDESPLVKDKQRLSALTAFLRTKSGLAIGNMNFLSSNFSTDHAFTGFGAILMMSEYSKTETQDLYKTFIDPENSEYSLKNQYDSWVTANANMSHTDSVDAFMSDYLLETLQRSRASFAISDLTTSRKAQYVQSTLEFKAAIDRVGLSDYLQGLATDEERTYRQNIYDAVEQHATLMAQATTDKERDTINTRLLAEVEYNTFRYNDQVNNAFTAETIQYLRKVNTAQSTFNGDSDDSIGQRMLAANNFAYNQLVLRLRRGRAENVNEAMFMAGYKLDVINKALLDFNLDPTLEHGEARLAVRSLVENTAMSEAQKQSFTDFGVQQFYYRSDDSGLSILTDTEVTNLRNSGELYNSINTGDIVQRTGLQLLQQSSAGLAQATAYMEELSQLQQMDQTAEVRAKIATIDAHLQDVLVSGNINVDRLQSFNANTVSPDQAEQHLNNIRNQINQRLGGGPPNDPNSPNTLNNPNRPTPPEMHSSNAGSATSALLSPLLFALSASDIKFDERIGMFTFDVLQASAELIDNSNSLLNRYSSPNKQVAGKVSSAYSVARVKEAMRQEGLFTGALAGIGQELLFQASGKAANALVQRTIGRRAALNPTGGNVAMAIGSELLSTVFAQSISRALYNVGTDGFFNSAEDPLLRILDDMVTNIWRAVEEAQLDSMNPNYEVIDTETNESIDFDVSAIPSDLEWDIESGLVVMESTGSAIDTSFEQQDSSINQSALASTRS